MKKMYTASNLKPLYQQNIDYVSEMGVLDSAQEECAELIQAISKFKRTKYDGGMPTNRTIDEAKDMLIEEIAHVIRSCESVIYKLSINESDIANEIIKGDQKIHDRIINNIKNVKGENK